MVTLTISLEDEIAEALKTLAERTQLSEEELVKNILSKYVVAPNQNSDQLVGLFDLGDPHLAENAEDILHASIKPHSGWTSKE